MKKYKLGEICTIVPGYAFKAADFGKGFNYVIKIKDIMPPYIDILHSEKVETVIDKKYEIKYGDFVMAMTGATIGKIGKLQIDSESKVYINQRVCKFIPEAFCDKEYLYYKLNTQEFQRFIYNNVDSKLAQPNIGHPTIYKYELELPLLSEQRRIGQFLKAIDDKINLNRAINHNLEAMAKQLYDYWFMQFDFPDENGKPYKSSGGKMVWNKKLKREIPEGWEVDNICKIAHILSGGTPSKTVFRYWKNGIIPFFSPTDCNGNIFQIETADHITQEGLEHCASSLFDEGTIFITARGSIGKLVIVGSPMAMNQSCYALLSKKDEYQYLYFLTFQLIECLKIKGSGSVFKSITISDIEKSLLCIANNEIITAFCKLVSPSLQKIKKNLIEIKQLTKLRDSLLPLLMNGQASLQNCD